jgi:hypothetical protein
MPFEVAWITYGNVVFYEFTGYNGCVDKDNIHLTGFIAASLACGYLRVLYFIVKFFYIVGYCIYKSKAKNLKESKNIDKKGDFEG